MALEYPFELPATLFHSIGMPINTQIDAATLDAFGKALMIIAGADDRVSVWERGWLTAYMYAYNAPREIIRNLDDFDYQNAELQDYLTPLLNGKYARWVRRSLLQGAIRMSRADEVSQAEYDAVLRAGEILGIPAPVVDEVRSLVEVFDTVTASNTVLLSIAQKEDAEEILQRRIVGQPRSGQLLPEDEALIAGQRTFARALFYVAGADGVLSESERDYFLAYMRSWGVEETYLQELAHFDYTSVTAQDIASESYTSNWGLSALTMVAIRMAGADGLAQEEENALLELYRLTDYSVMHYYTARGLEDVRSHVLNRLNAIFEKYQ